MSNPEKETVLTSCFKKIFIMRYLVTIILCMISFKNTNAQKFDAKYFNSMQWRCIGPHRGGRTVGAVGVPVKAGEASSAYPAIVLDVIVLFEKASVPTGVV